METLSWSIFIPGMITLILRGPLNPKTFVSWKCFKKSSASSVFLKLISLAERHSGSPGDLFVSQLKKHLETPTFAGTAKPSDFVLEALTTGKMEIEKFPKTFLALAASNINTIKKTLVLC